MGYFCFYIVQIMSKGDYGGVLLKEVKYQISVAEENALRTILIKSNNQAVAVSRLCRLCEELFT